MFLQIMEIVLVILSFLVSRKFFSSIVPIISNNVFFGYISMIMQQILGVFLPAFLISHFRHKNLIEKKAFALEVSDIFLFAFLGIVLQLAGNLINVPFIYILDKFGINNIPNNMNYPDNSYLFIVYVLAVCFIPAICEELLFRKFIYKYLSKFNCKIAILLSALLFAILHFNVFIFVSTFMLGVVFSYSIYKGYPLIATMISHFFVNLTGICITIIDDNSSVGAIFYNYYALFCTVAIFMVIIIMKKISQKERT